MEKSYNIHESTWQPKTYIIQRATKSFDKLSDFFGKAYGSIYGLIQKLGIKTNEPHAPFILGLMNL